MTRRKTSPETKTEKPEQESEGLPAQETDARERQEPQDMMGHELEAARLEARERALREREEDLLSREQEFASFREQMASQAAPRERDNESRSRVLDSTSRLERQSFDYYAPPSQLEVPKDDEWHYRWVAEYVNGAHMPRLVQIRLREGYERVPRDALPEDFLVDEDAFGDGWARQSGLILMRWPKTHQAARTRYYQNLSQERLQSADELQGVAGRDAVREDRGTRALTGAEAGRALATMSQR